MFKNGSIAPDWTGPQPNKMSILLGRIGQDFQI
jgi:hypothetical protein